jgi:hypothetical protein
LTVLLVSQNGSLLGSAVRDQFRLDNSDGTTWQDLGPAAGPQLQFAAPADGVMLVSANADLWTANAGVNQDLGTVVSGGTYPTRTGEPEAWKESGGFAGTFSPNAAFLQAALPVKSGIQYQLKLQWKANHPAAGSSIFTAAGPIGGLYSSTALSLRFINGGINLVDRVATSQYRLDGSDGAGWTETDSAALALSANPSSNCVALISGNVDLWTATAGVNQDVAIAVSASGATASTAIVGWKESGGFAGTFSPNAAFVQAVVPMLSGNQYIVKLKWKANRPVWGSSIFAGAGPIDGSFSPTRLTAQLFCD